MSDDDKTPVEVPKGTIHRHSWITISSLSHPVAITNVVWCPCGVVFVRKEYAATDRIEFTEYRPGSAHALHLKDIIGEFGVSCGGRRCGGCAACQHFTAVGGCFENS